MRTAKIYCSIVFSLYCVAVSAQTDDFRKKFDEFRAKAKAEYQNFRDEANKAYADFVRNAWKAFTMMPAEPQPQEKQVPPVVLEDEEQQEPVEDAPVEIVDTMFVPQPEPQPVPVAPIREQPVEVESRVDFSVFGTEMSVRFSDDLRFTLPECTEQVVADAWERLSSADYNNTVRDCLMLRITRQLNDWAYIQMLRRMADACMPEKNAATLLAAYVYCQSGYKMRLACCEGQLEMLCASEHTIYGHSYICIDDDKYYYFGDKDCDLSVCEAAYPKERPMSLLIGQPMELAVSLSEPRTLSSDRYMKVKATVSVNKNLTEFFDSYPTSCIDGNFMTRWAMYANMPLDSITKAELYPQLQEAIEGESELEKVDRLLNWVQTAFTYEYDDVVWGQDRAFFAEETLYYPFSDCEDRSILFSRLVRDLVGLKVILIYYPGHMATAVRFTEQVNGDYIMLNGVKYVVCDPTFINACVGRTMPEMDNAAATAILLD